MISLASSQSDDGLSIFVVLVDLVTDGSDELFEVVKHRAPDAVFGQAAKEELDHVRRPRPPCQAIVGAPDWFGTELFRYRWQTGGSWPADLC